MTEPLLMLAIFASLALALLVAWLLSRRKLWPRNATREQLLRMAERFEEAARRKEDRAITCECGDFPNLVGSFRAHANRLLRRAEQARARAAHAPSESPDPEGETHE